MLLKVVGPERRDIRHKGTRGQDRIKRADSLRRGAQLTAVIKKMEKRRSVVGF